MAPIVRQWAKIMPTVINPLSLPRHPLALASFGLRALLSISLLARVAFRGERARGLLAGLGGHSFLPMEAPLSAAPGLVLGALGHSVGWPIPAGGAQALANALAAYLRELGGEIVTGWRVAHLDELPPARAVLCDITPKQLLTLTGHRLPDGYRHRLERFRLGPGIFKLDYALDGPVPWAAPGCARAATIHLGGTLEQIAAAERAPHLGQHAAQPYVLLSQPTRFDPTRAPPGKHIVWAYCHVPRGSSEDMADRIEAQIERFAPGFRQRVIARSAMGPAAMERYNANLIGGDISGGLPDWRQMITRPVLSPWPYSTPAPGLFICSSSTPPGAGVHGMCGYHAAQAALRKGL
jgi:phytoene dehydrogenase-like protein